MKNLFTKVIILVSLIQGIDSIYSREIVNENVAFHSEEETYPEYPLLESRNVINLIDKTWGNIDDERTLNIGNTILELLLEVAAEVRDVDAETVLGADPALFADSIISGVEEIKNHTFDNIQREINCIWGYADKVIRYLGAAEYTILG